MVTSIAGCTVISKNYLPFARTLADSFITYHKDASFFVLLVDRIDGYFDPSKEKFQLIEVGELDNIEHKEQMFFKYNPMELNTAMKPYFLEYIFKHYPVNKLLYLDSDILITKGLNEIQTIMDTYSIVLIPHITSPISINDKALPNEMSFLLAGAYNLGFIGLSKTEESSQFIQWWKERLWHFCLIDIQNGLFVDQKWIDLVPSLFKKVYILKDPGYNVAYWNLHEKKFAIRNDELMVNNMPLFFFHFSGFDPNKMESISKSNTRYKLSDFKELRGFFELYIELLIKNGYYVSRMWPYSHAVYDNGEKIEDRDRRRYWAMGEKVEKFGNPFQTKHSQSFYAYLVWDRLASKIYNPIISAGIKHHVRIGRIPFIGRIAKLLYHAFVLLTYKGNSRI
jgi:lipopolysaccharide biosynthesis glycosyltransferase